MGTKQPEGGQDRQLQAQNVWITKKDAAEAVGTTVRQIERYMQRGLLRKQMAEGRNGPVALVNAEDCRRVKHRREAGPVTVAIEKPAPLALAAPAEAPQPPRPWLTLVEAAEFSGLPASWLKRAATSGQVEAINCGSIERPRWRFHRDSLARPMSTRLFPASYGQGFSFGPTGQGFSFGPPGA